MKVFYKVDLNHCVAVSELLFIPMIKFFITLFICAITLASSKLNWSQLSGYDYSSKKDIQLQFESKRNNIGVFYFLSSTCPCSRGYFEYLNNLVKKYKGFNFIGFHSNKKTERIKVAEHFDRFQITFPILNDKSLIHANKFKALKTPHVFVVNGAGEILYSGGITNSRNIKKSNKFYLEDALDDISRGETPKVKHARVLGCYISR